MADSKLVVASIAGSVANSDVKTKLVTASGGSTATATAAATPTPGWLALIHRLKSNSIRRIERNDLRGWTGDALPLVNALIDNTSVEHLSIDMYGRWRGVCRALCHALIRSPCLLQLTRMLRVARCAVCV